MASSLIHLAVTDILLSHFSFHSPARLRFGSILPDAGDGNSHLKITLCNGTKLTYDLNRFRKLFASVFRSFLFFRKGRQVLIRFNLHGAVGNNS